MTEAVNATKKQQPWQLSFADIPDLCKIGNDFYIRMMNYELCNQFGQFTESGFI